MENKYQIQSKMKDLNQQTYLEIGDLLNGADEWNRDELLDCITMIIDKYYD